MGPVAAIGRPTAVGALRPPPHAPQLPLKGQAAPNPEGGCQEVDREGKKLSANPIGTAKQKTIYNSRPNTIRHRIAIVISVMQLI